MRMSALPSIVAGCLLIAATHAPALAQADFYKGKTVTVVVGTRVGGSIGNTSLVVSRHLSKHIPGNPAVILRQMPGGAHLNATNHVFNVAEADGLTILGVNPAVAMAQLSKVKQVRFDVQQFQWIGSTGPDGMLFAIRASLPYKSFKDLQNAPEEIVVGTTGPGSNSHDVPMLLKEFAGAKIKLISGFQATVTSGLHSSAGKPTAGPHLRLPSDNLLRQALCARCCGAAVR
jgi:tripartite-type tricarboxylate transporter receptor subunit TctC